MNDLTFKVMEDSLSREAIEEAVELHKGVLLEKAGTMLLDFSWPMLRSGIVDAILDVVQSDKLPWIVKGWAKAKELRGFKDETKFPPDKISYLKLGKHELGGELKPVVTVNLDGQPLTEIEFTAPVLAKLNAVSISIQGGKITGMGGGECQFSVGLELAGTKLFEPVDLGKLSLPGKITLQDPIEIP